MPLQCARLSCSWTCASILLLFACSEPTDIFVPEPDVRPSTGKALGTMSFFFPVELTFDGRSETCAKGASERPLGDVPREDFFYVGEWLFADRRRSPIFEKLIRDTFGAK